MLNLTVKSCLTTFPWLPTGTQAVMSKMVLDQTIWAAAVNGIYLSKPAARTFVCSAQHLVVLFSVFEHHLRGPFVGDQAKSGRRLVARDEGQLVSAMLVDTRLLELNTECFGACRYVWPAVQIVNFKFVPVPLQGAVALLAFACVLS